jgi:pimeloyl-ACP methyl ester carboxylesterase
MEPMSGSETQRAGDVDWTLGAADLPSGRIAYRRAGAGRRVLYLHDAGADTLASPAFDDLTVDHDLVLVDLPGYGRSDPPRRLTTPADIADALAHLLDHLDWRTALVAGTSLGGWFATELAIAHPQRVSALLLADAAGLHTPEDYLFALFSEGRAAANAEQLVADAIWSRLPEDEAVADDPEVAAAVWQPWVAELAAAASWSWHPYTRNPRLLALLPRIAAPTVVLWGERDALIPLEHGRVLRQRIPGAELRVVEGAGHLVALDAPAAFAEALRAAGARIPAT